MRITNNIIQQTSLANVQRNLRDLYRAQESVTTGKRITRASVDPMGASISMETRSSIRALDQYQRGIDTASSRAAAEETVLDRLAEILVRARELGVASASDNTNTAQRIVAASEIEELLKEAVSLANTAYGEGYLFTGTGAASEPYGTTLTAGNVDFTTTNPTGHVEIQVSSNHSVIANHSGVEVFEDTNLLASLRDLAIALKTGDSASIAGALPTVDDAFDSVQALIGAVGSKHNSLLVTAANIGALKSGLTVLKSDVEDVEIETAVTELLARQTSYQAALMTTSRVLGMSLADYLR